MILRMLPFGNFITTQEILFYFRQHVNSATTSNFEDAYFGECLSVLSYHHRQQGYADFLDNFPEKTTDWQVLGHCSASTNWHLGSQLLGVEQNSRF
jgi:hypothetical protein